MRRPAFPGICIGMLLLCLFASPCGAFSEAAKNAGEPERRVLAVLDPIDLHILKADPDWGDFLRRGFAENRGWKVITRDTMIAKMKDYGMDTRVPCHEFQCAFD